MKDHNKEIRNLTESANNLQNLNENPALPYAPLMPHVWNAIEYWFFARWIRENYPGLVTKWCDMECLYNLWVKMGRPTSMPGLEPKPEPDDGGGDDTPPTDMPSPSSPTHPLNRPTL